MNGFFVNFSFRLIFTMTKQTTIPFGALFFTLLYLIVHFIPDLGGADVMGAQWLYSSVIDLLVVLYLFLYRNQYKEAINVIFQYRFTLVFTLLLCWAMGSYFYAINPTESLVTLARLVTTYLIFINLSILYYKQSPVQILNLVSYIVAFILLYDAIYILKMFSNNLNELKLDQNLLSLTGNHGNKNVMAVSLLFKFPFVV